MKLGRTEIVDTFAEAFPMTAARVVVTAVDDRWVRTAAAVSTGYATSVIACDCEAAVERFLPSEETPDGRPGASLLLFGFSRDKLQAALVNRIGQCLLTCPTTAVYDGIPLGTPNAKPEHRVRVGGQLRYFGDGRQTSKKWFDRRLWRIPTMDGEFVCEDEFGTLKGVGGGNFLIVGRTQREALDAAERAVEAIQPLPDVILPFPGGVVRSGSKVGSKYPKLRASTNEAYCPTIRGTVSTALPPEGRAVYELVIDGLSTAAVELATRIGVEAACGPGIVQITAGNYGGKLGPFHFHLHRILAPAAAAV